jgi:hypothetical protein
MLTVLLLWTQFTATLPVAWAGIADKNDHKATPQQVFENRPAAAPVELETIETNKDLANKKEIMKKAARAGMPFMVNQGQIDHPAVRFYTQTLGAAFFVTNEGEMVYSFVYKDKAQREKELKESRLHKEIFEDEKEKDSGKSAAGKGWALKEKLVGGLKTKPQGVDQAVTKVNYFIGNDRSKWKSNISTYNGISLGEVYPGIELNLKSYGNNVEKIFTVKPGAEAKAIMLQMEGASSLTVNQKGELKAGTAFGPIRFTAPVAYQEKDGKRQYVTVEYRLGQDNVYGFTVGDYDKSRPLIIDPLLASTFIGGEERDYIRSMTIDDSNNI